MTKQSLLRMGADRKLLIAVIVAVVAMLGILAVNADRAYAGEYSGTVYFNLSHDGKPVMSDVTGDPMMMVPVNLQAVADVDLAEWGLEDYAYQEYGGDGTQDPECPTALKLFLYMHEQYKDDPQNSITVTGSVHSAYMSMFWGMDENLNYYVNGAYPLFEGGWGATCDGIALEDGDRVDVMHFSNWSFWTDAMAGFNFFADANSDPGDGAIVETYNAVVGEPLPVQVIRGYGSLAIGGATEYHAADDLAIHVSGKNSLIDPNDEEVGTLDGGMAELTFDEPGLYYIWVEGGEGDDGTIVQSAAAAMVDVSASDNRKPKLASGVSATESESINPSQNYSVDLSKIFTDPDEDPLTYKVSVDGGDYVACDKDYVYTPAGEGAVTLKFKANDGQVDSDDTYTVNLTVSKDVLVKVEGLKIIDDQCREWPIYVLADYETPGEYKAALGNDDYCYPVYKLTLPSAIDFTIVEDQDVFSVLDPDWGITRNVYSLKNDTFIFGKDDYEAEEEAHSLPVEASKYQGTEITVSDYRSARGYDLRKIGYSSPDRMVALEVYGAWNQRMQGNYADSYHILIDYDSSAQPSGSGHDLTKVEQVDATCTVDGTKAYWTCSNCNKMFSDEAGKNEITAPESIPAGHDWGEPEYTWSDDNRKVTASRVCNKVSSHVDEEESTCEFYVGRNPTCKVNGATVYTAKFTKSAFKTQTKTVNDILALGHDMTEHEAKDATCLEAGNSKYYCCGNCSKFFSDANGETEIEENSWVIDAKGHDMTEHEAKDATCLEAGNTGYYSCGRCNKFFSDDTGETEIEENSWVIDAIGHKWGDWKVIREATEQAEGEETRFCEHDASHTETRLIPKLEPVGSTVRTVTINVKTVNKKAVDNAVKKAGGTAETVTTIVLGKKVKKIKKGAFKTYRNMKTLEVRTKKLKKKTVRGSLKGSKVKTIKVKVGSKKTNKKYVKKYRKIFTKKNAGKKVRITR